MNSISVAMSPQIYVYYGMADLGYFNRERGGEGLSVSHRKSYVLSTQSNN